MKRRLSKWLRTTVSQLEYCIGIWRIQSYISFLVVSALPFTVSQNVQIEGIIWRRDGNDFGLLNIINQRLAVPCNVLALLIFGNVLQFEKCDLES